MKRIMSSFIGGIAGASALNVLHQTFAQIDHEAPRVDLIGEEAMKKLGTNLSGNALFTATLAADLLSNAAYYSLAGLAKKRYILPASTALGFAAGFGALTLTKPM